MNLYLNYLIIFLNLIVSQINSYFRYFHLYRFEKFVNYFLLNLKVMFGLPCFFNGNLRLPLNQLFGLKFFIYRITFLKNLH